MDKFFHIISVGTSILRNFERSQEYGSIVKKYGLTNWGELKPDAPEQKIIEGFIIANHEVHKSLLEFVKKDPYLASAELNSFLKYIAVHKHGKDDTEIAVYCTDTHNNRLAAQIIYEYLREEGFSIVGEPIKVKDFGVGIEEFHSGLVNLLEKVLRIIINKSKQGYKIYINATAGYKPEVTFMALAAMLTLKVAPKIYYIHEAFKENVELPALPLKIDEKYLDIAKMFMEPKPMHEAEETLKKYRFRLDDLLNSQILSSNEGLIQTKEWLRKIIQLYEA
ncbi:MAG: putative CRISPR-associated protein [Candidatus Bathyarchaeia archaeon]